MRRFGLMLLVALTAVTAALAFTKSEVSVVRATGNEQITNQVMAKAGNPKNPSPGDTVGMTSFDWTHNGGMGQHLGIDAGGGLHFHWTYRDLAGTTGSRLAMYNYRAPDGTWLGGVNWTGHAGSRWGTGACKPAAGLGAGCAYYTLGSYYPVVFGCDAVTGLGLFDIFVIDSTVTYAHPYITFASDDTIYIAADGDADDVMFERSYDGGVTWNGWTNIGDPVNFPCNFPNYNIAAWHSKVAYAHLDTSSNLFIRESTDYGQTWGTIRTVVVPGVDLGPDGDTIVPYIHVFCRYDTAGNLHVFDSYYSGGGQDYQGIFQWNQATGITYVNRLHVGDTTRQIGGQNTMRLSWPYMCVHADTMICSYTMFDLSDIAANGYANGDIWVTESFDNGATWPGLPNGCVWSPLNITNSSTPGAVSGACADDRYGVVEVYGDTIHFFWLSSQNAYSSLYVGVPTMDPLLHFTLRQPDGGGVAGNMATPAPVRFTVSRAYPNPASSFTNIAFSLPKAGPYNLHVYNINGQLVKSIEANGNAGHNAVILNTKDMSNGVFFYQLNAGDKTRTQKLTVIR